LYYNSSTPTQTHYRPLLSWHGADRRASFERVTVPPEQQAIQQQNGFYRWTIPVEPRHWDSPYANSTAWKIEAYWSGRAAQNINMGGVTYMDGDYHLLVRAFR
jgi:hypothetical protein